jgi:hypothetical protein
MAHLTFAAFIFNNNEKKEENRISLDNQISEIAWSVDL